jgi:hypothetical protein
LVTEGGFCIVRLCKLISSESGSELFSSGDAS